MKSLRCRAKNAPGMRAWRSGSVALETVLLLPILLMMLGATSQFMLFAKHRAMAEHAAFAAARSVLAQSCAQATSGPRAIFGGSTSECDVDEDVARRAAAWALLPAGPASGRGGFGSDCPAAAHALTLMRAADMQGNLTDALRNKACYVYSPTVLTLDVSRDTPPRRAAQADIVTVSVTINFKFPINAPIGLFMSDGRHADGTPWRWGSATMVAS